MDIVEQVMKKVNEVFDAENLEALARATGFLKRQRKIMPKDFLENMMVLTLNSQENSLDDLANEFYTQNNCLVSKQALQKKFNPAAARFIQAVLDQLLEHTINESKIHLGAIDFINSIRVYDSSEIRLHNKLKDIFPQVRQQGAAVKLQALMNVVTSQILSLDVRPSKEPDQAYKKHLTEIERNDLMLGDLGYFSIESFCEIEAKGAFFLSRYFKRTNLYDQKSKKRLDLRELLRQSQKNTVDLEVLLGISKFSCRLVAIKLPADAYEKRLLLLEKKHCIDPRSRANEFDLLNQWTIFITNLPQSLDAMLLLQIYRLRWQIELLFKTMKTFLQLRRIDDTNQYRTIISLKISLIAMLLLSFVAMTITNTEVSLYKTCKIFVKNIRGFLGYIKNKKKCAISWLKEMLYKCTSKESRPSRPSTRQSLRWRYINA